MRWIKHMTATRQDEKIARLIAEHGHAAYGLWWMVLEVVAARVEGNSQPSVTYPVTTWSHLLSLRGSHVRQAISKLAVTHLVTAEWNGSDLTVTIPNLLKYRDEYSRKSGHTPESVGSKKQIQNTDTDTENRERDSAPDGAGLSLVPSPENEESPDAPPSEEIPPDTPGVVRPPVPAKAPKKAKRTTEEIKAALGAKRLPWWEGFWGVYPCHDGMRAAMDAYERLIHSRELAVQVYNGAKRYAGEIATKRQRDPEAPVKFGQGWLNDERWRDDAPPPLPVVACGPRVEYFDASKITGERA